MAQQQQQLQAFSEEYRKIQDGTPSADERRDDNIWHWVLIMTVELSELVRARQKLESQYTENKNVQEVGAPD